MKRYLLLIGILFTASFESSASGEVFSAKLQNDCKDFVSQSIKTGVISNVDLKAADSVRIFLGAPFYAMSYPDKENMLVGISCNLYGGRENKTFYFLHGKTGKQFGMFSNGHLKID